MMEKIRNTLVFLFVLFLLQGKVHVALVGQNGAFFI